MKALKYTLFLAIAMIIACTKPPDYSNTPEIEFVSFSKTILDQGPGFEDTTYLTISFTDGDGDIGGDTFNTIFFVDTRINNDFLKYAAPSIPEQGTGNGISGEMTIQMFTSCCIHPDPNFASLGCNAPFESTGVFFDTLIYEVYIRDRAGNKSNTILTEPLILKCQ